MAGLRSLLSPAKPTSMPGWSYTKDQRPGVDAHHFQHAQHGIVSISKDPSTGNYEVKHAGGPAKLQGQHNVYTQRQGALSHAIDYMKKLTPVKGSQPKQIVGKAEVGSSVKTPDAEKVMGQPVRPGALGAAISHIEAEKARDVQQSMAAAAAAKTFKGEKPKERKASKSLLRKKLKKRKVLEPLLKPYASEAQRRWAHTEAGTKALGGKKAVQHWDKASKGKKLPEKVKKSESEYFGKLLSKARIKGAKGVSAISQADNQIKPLMHDIQSGFDSIKKQIHAAAANPSHPESKDIMSKYMVSVGKKGEVKADNHRVMRAAVEEQWKKDPSRFIPRITVDNSKLENEAIGAWTTPAVVTCPGARDCKSFCFAKNDQVQYKNSLAKRFVNMYARKHPEFEKHINNQLAAMRDKKEVAVKDWDKPVGTKVTSKGRTVPADYAQALDEKGRPIIRRWNTFRIHDSGDFDTPEYADKWHSIVKQNPDINFYAYTKSYSHPEIWKKLKTMHEELPNFKIIQSLGGVDERVDPSLPHAVIFENEDQLKRAGYTASHNYDSRASDKNNRDVGLVIFGGGKGKYGNLKEHLKKAHGIRHKLSREGNLHAEEYEHPDLSAGGKPEKLAASEMIDGFVRSEELVHAHPESPEAEQALQPDHYHQERIQGAHMASLHPLRRMLRKRT